MYSSTLNRSLHKDSSIRESSSRLLKNVRVRINDELYRKVSKTELLDRNDLRSKNINNLSDKLIYSINEYDRLKEVKSSEMKDEKQIADLLNKIG